MKICIISYEYAPFPGGGIATYHNAAAKLMSQGGHEVHVVTNNAWHGSRDPSCTQRRWQDGNLTIHRLPYFNERREVPPKAGFLDVVPARYEDRTRTWATEPSNQAASKAAAYVEALHAEIGLDVIESPEFFAEAFYIIRRRHAGDGRFFPPVCVHGHISSRIAFGTNHHAWELGWYPHRQMMLREEYCVQEADALITPSRALMRKYEQAFETLPAIRATIPYFLEVPEACEQLPEGLDSKNPYLVCVGRMEPRKGSDLAMRAFTQIADDYPDLKLVFLGKEMWHQGEKVSDVIALNVAERHRSRIVKLGNVPRDQALAAVKQASAFLHPAPWDNYPCANMEAMGIGAVCIVSDQGGQSEMVEDGESGLVFPANDGAALAACIRRVLDDPELASKFRQGAAERMARITEPKSLLEQKLAVFEQMLSREKERLAGLPEVLALAPSLQVSKALPAVPKKGCILLDAGKAKAESIASSKAMLLDELESSPDWSVTVLLDPGQDADLPSTWKRVTTLDKPVWQEQDDDEGFVYVLAGTRLDRGRLRNLVCQVFDAGIDSGSFHWLRPADARVFPYSPDFGLDDLMIGGRILPPIFALRAKHLGQCEFMSGLYEPLHRLCALMASACAAHGIMFQHCGVVSGDFYGELPFVTQDVQGRALGFLDVLGIGDRKRTVYGNMPIPMTPTADTERLIAKARREGQEGAQPTKETRTPAPSVGNGVDPAHLAELEKVYKEHMALKNSKLARMMRKMKAFDAIRKVFPKSKKGLGSGD